MKRKHSKATRLKMSRSQRARHARNKKSPELTYKPWIVKAITDTIRHFIG